VREIRRTIALLLLNTDHDSALIGARTLRPRSRGIHMSTCLTAVRSLPSLVTQSFNALCETLPFLVGFAMVSAMATAMAAFALPPVAIAVIPFTHAAFMVAACRAIAHRIDPDLVSQRLPIANWMVCIVVVGTLAAGIAVAVGRQLGSPMEVAGIVAASVALAWTPFLPAMALGIQSPVGALRVTLWYLPAFVPIAAIVSAPFLIVTELLGFPAQTCTGECWGLFEGGLFMLPLFGAHMFFASCMAALVSTVVYAAFYRDFAPARRRN
jgi:hypothetical protein